MPCLLLALILCASSAWAPTVGAAPQASSAHAQKDAATAAAPAQQPAGQDSKADEPSGQKQLTPAEHRQAQLAADTNKLYQLAQELQAEVAKSSKDMLSLAVVKKAAEVEKLAKSLKERAKTE